MLVLTRKRNQSLVIGNDIEIQILEVSGEQVRIGIKAPPSVRILRKELFDEIHHQNLAAAVNPAMLDNLKKIKKTD
ncbi:carbon storage regulator CsrA [bacterium]|nr:carbon storage regulator CsrA [bacterium]